MVTKQEFLDTLDAVLGADVVVSTLSESQTTITNEQQQLISSMMEMVDQPNNFSLINDGTTTTSNMEQGSCCGMSKDMVIIFSWGVFVVFSKSCDHFCFRFFQKQVTTCCCSSRI